MAWLPALKNSPSKLGNSHTQLGLTSKLIPFQNEGM